MGDEDRPYVEISDNVLNDLYNKLLDGATFSPHVPVDIQRSLEIVAIFHALNGHQERIVCAGDIIALM